MKREILAKILFVPFIIFGLIGVVNAQDINEAKEAYNNALKLAVDDPTTAIASVNSCIEICDEIGEGSEDVKALAEGILPKLYMQVGTNLIKAKKVTQAIPAFQETLKVAEQYNNKEYITKSKSMLPKLYNSVGGSYYKKNDFNKALENLNQAVVYDPDYAKAYYTMCLVYKKMEDAANFELTADKGIIAATNSKDNKTKALITKAATNYFLAGGTKALSDSKGSDAVELLTKSLKYDPKGIDTYFYLASAQNEVKNFDGAIEACNKALELEGEDQEKNAKHYYNLGLAYKGKNDKGSACEAFNKALFGQFKENAQYEIEHGLKCNE